jgi:transcriptional regulator with XRE-family HTH domain
MAKFAGLLGAYIKQAGLPLRRVASQTGIPHQTLFNWLKGSQPRWHAALPRDLHRLGVSLSLTDDETTLLLRLAGCTSVRSGPSNVKEAMMENSFRIPKGWFAGGDAPDKYEMGLDPAVMYENRPSVTMKAGPDPAEFAALVQSFKAEWYHGKRLRFSAAVRSVEIECCTALFMRIAGTGDQLLAFDNMRNRQITGTTEWTHHAIVLDVAENAESIQFGFLMAGKGQAWMADVHLDVVDRSVPTTDILEEVAPFFPANLDFVE